MMTQVSLLDKLRTLIDVTSTSPYFIGIIVFLILLTILFITTNKNNSKQSKIIYLLIYSACFLFLIFKYGSSLKDMLDYLMNNLFIFFYFPNLAAYLAGIIITNIILWKTIFTVEVNNILKIVNSIVYCLLHYILILILNIITTKNLNIFSDISVYKNKQALSLIELSSMIFIVWILFILIFSMIKAYQNRGEKQYKVETIEYVIKPEKIQAVEAPMVIYKEKPSGFSIPKEKPLLSTIKPSINQTFMESIPAPVTTNIPVAPIVGNINTTVDILQPAKASTDSIKILDNLFTIEDYKLLLNVLTEQKNQANQIQIKMDSFSKVQENNCLEKENSRQLTELEALYQSVK